MQRRANPLIVGRLLEHGPASYQFRQGESASYYLKVATRAGVRLLWGKDLERAVRAGRTRPNIGEMIGARRVSREPVTVKQAAGHADKHTHRTRWEVEKVQHFAERIRLARQVRDRHTDAREAVRRHPELVSTFLTLRGAEHIAARRIAHPQDRVKFLALVREAMANSVAHGDPIPDVRLKDPPAQKDSEQRNPRRQRDDTTR